MKSHSRMHVEAASHGTLSFRNSAIAFLKCACAVAYRAYGVDFGARIFCKYLLNRGGLGDISSTYR